MVQAAEFDFKGEFPNRVMIGRVYRVDTIGDGPRGRTSFEFDALDENCLRDGGLRRLFLSDDVEPFGLVRVLTTPTRFGELFEVEPREGSWYRLQLTPRELALRRRETRKVMAWHAQLTPEGYTRRSRGYITGAEFLSGDGEPPLKSLSAASSSAKAANQGAIAAAQFPNITPIDNHAVATFLQGLHAVDKIQVHDVGQASFLTLYDINDRPIVHYDAGWPVAFNGETIPASPPVCQSAPVILSHWDWDHLSGYYRFPALKLVKWITPEQHLGFGAARVASRLDNDGLLMGFNGAPVGANSLTLGVCVGHSGSNNQTGLALRVALPSKIMDGVVSGPRAALLTGDADYDSTPATLKTQPLHALLVTHHGAHFNGVVPKGPKDRGCAVVSVGKGNRYKHPKARAIRRHLQRDWDIQMTCSWAHLSRGPKWIR